MGYSNIQKRGRSQSLDAINRDHTPPGTLSYAINNASSCAQGNFDPSRKIRVLKPIYQQGLLDEASKGSVEGIEVLLEMKVDVNTRNKVGVTPLMLAAQDGYTLAVQRLLEAGADVNCKEVGGFTALMLAAQNGHDAVVTLLLQYKADVDAKTNNGETAFKLAQRYGHTAICERLSA